MTSEVPSSRISRVSPVAATGLVALLLCVVAAGVWFLMRGPGAGPALPRFGTVPAFTLLSEQGNTVTRDNFAGKVWIADFIFTRCGGSCPIVSSKMAALAKRMAGVPGVNFVSFDVDPEHDTPEILAAYGRKLGADPTRWKFLHGERPVIHGLIKDGFKLAIEDGVANSVEPILHSTRLVLVDGEGTIRGYYDGMTQPPVDRLEKDARALAAASKGGV